MKRLNIISIIILSLMIPTGNAHVLDCIGDSQGMTIHMIQDTASSTMNVNGRIHRVVLAQPITTENYVTEQGTLVYDSLEMGGAYITLYQYNAETSSLIAAVPLACHDYE